MSDTLTHLEVPAPPRRGLRGGHLLRLVAIVYVAILVLVPVVLIVVRTWQEGGGALIDAFTSADATSAIALSARVMAYAVVFNVVFGVGAALLLARYRFTGRWLFDLLIDVPVSVSPIVVGLGLVLTYGVTNGWFGTALQNAGYQIVFATPGLVLATTFVSLPLIVRELVPVLEEAGIEQEQAARSLGANAWQRFWRITLPTMRWGLAYGIVLSVARSLGEYGAVRVVAGNVAGSTQTLTLRVDDLFTQQLPGYYQTALLLIAVSVVCIGVITFVRPSSGRRGKADS